MTISYKSVQRETETDQILRRGGFPLRLTEAAADVDVEVDGVVSVVHQVTVSGLDQRVQVVLLPIGVKHVAGHLQDAFTHGASFNI